MRSQRSRVLRSSISHQAAAASSPRRNRISVRVSSTTKSVVSSTCPAFQIVPVNDVELPGGNLDDEPLHRAGAVGRSADGRTAADHDAVIYGK